jgi:hypothetical protein
MTNDQIYLRFGVFIKYLLGELGIKELEGEYVLYIYVPRDGCTSWILGHINPNPPGGGHIVLTVI